MAPLSQFRSLSNLRLNRIIGTLAAQLEIQRPLLYLRRLNLVPAFDDELVGRFTGKIIAADLIADDQEAVVQESLSMELITNAAPNIKLGQRLGQKLINRLRQFEQMPTTTGMNALKDWDMRIAENLLLGIRWRMNAIACAMMIDSFSYNRLGVNISAATWGMPSNLKVTVGTAWSTAATATPLSDIWGMDQVASLAYGIRYDKITMTTPDFRNMVATTEFANKATLVLGANFLLAPTAIPTKEDPRTMQIAMQVLGKTIELDDFQFNTRNNAGTITTSRALPTGTVLLSRTQDEGDDNVMDFSNGVPTESIVAGMVGGGGEGVPVDQYGPLAYWTSREDMNPPDVVAWGVAKGFARKHIPEATAVLNGV